jgi:hypothetical protein
MDFTDEQMTILELEAAKTDQVKAKTSKFFEKVLEKTSITGLSRQLMMRSEPISIDIALRVPIRAFTDQKLLNKLERHLSEEWGVKVYLMTITK